MSDSSDSSPPAPESDPNTPPPSDTSFSPPPSDQGSASSPPSDGQGPSAPPSPSPPDNSATPSPPPRLESPPPSSPPPPPSESNTPPPSESPPPSNPTPSPPKESTPAPSDTPPSKSSPVSPPPSHSKKSPPPSETTPSPPSPESPPPTNDSPSPPSSDDQQSPPPPESESPPSSSISSPANTNTPAENPPPPNVPSEFAPPTDSMLSPPPPSESTPSLSLSPPRSDSRSESSSNSTSNSPSESNVHSGTVVGVAVAGVFIIALIAMFFVCARRRRKRAEVYAAAHYMPAGTFSVKSEGYYVGQQHNINISNSGPADSFFPSQGPNSFINNSYGSQRGIASYGGGLESGLIGGPNPYFSYEELTEITNGFSTQNVLGEGGFGCVYKGCLPDGKVVAVKQLKAGSGQGEREFKAEVEIISRVHHRHLVSLVGYCISEQQRLLIYEFVPNKTLEHHLHGDGMPVLEWTKRLKIALGAAKGLAYLHEDCHPKIIHRDIKSANILLDDAFEAQVADFGLAKPSNDTHTHVSTRVMGKFGYMAPEYASSGKLTDRSDVFSFGVVLLELVTGRKPVDPSQPLGDESLVEWARPLLILALETGDTSELVDQRLEKHYVESEMIRMIEAAAACVRHSAPKRPRMVQVARALDCEGEMSDLTNGVKYGQSIIYDSGQYNQDIMKFRRMALGDSSEYDMYSGEFNNSREVSGYQSSWNVRDSSSGESDTRAFTARNVGEQRYGGSQSNFGSRLL